MKPKTSAKQVAQYLDSLNLEQLAIVLAYVIQRIISR